MRVSWVFLLASVSCSGLLSCASGVRKMPLVTADGTPPDLVVAVKSISKASDGHLFAKLVVTNQTDETLSVFTTSIASAVWRAADIRGTNLSLAPSTPSYVTVAGHQTVHEKFFLGRPSDSKALSDSKAGTFADQLQELTVWHDHGKERREIALLVTRD